MPHRLPYQEELNSGNLMVEILHNQQVMKTGGIVRHLVQAYLSMSQTKTAVQRIQH
jgi:hypothetical protein